MSKTNETNNQKKYTKNDIDQLAQKIMGELENRCLAGDVCIYVNNIRYSSKLKKDWRDLPWDVSAYHFTEDEGEYNPLDYFEYAAHKHILSLSTEGGFYDKLNYGSVEWFNTILGEYGLYYELGNAWNLTVYPMYDEEIEKWEYTDYSQSKAIVPTPVHLFNGSICDWSNYPMLKPINDMWFQLSKETGDKGGCVLGAGISFEYNGENIFMSPASPWQGEGSWTPHVNLIKEVLKYVGCTNIIWHHGRLD